MSCEEVPVKHSNDSSEHKRLNFESSGVVKTSCGFSFLSSCKGCEYGKCVIISPCFSAPCFLPRAVHIFSVNCSVPGADFQNHLPLVQQLPSDA